MMNRKSLLIVLSLVFLEWLDFSLYLYLAKSVFAQKYFPTSQYSLVLSFALFATAFLARPLGGWFFGKAADLSGRRTPLIVSAAMMGGATIAIGLLPDYHSIGLAATWGLLILRILQGLALGGEINNSAMFLIEHHSNKPLVTGSFVAASGAVGFFVGGALAAILQSLAIDWLWRGVFVLIGVISLCVCQLRKKLQESPEFIPNNTKIIQIIAEAKKSILNIAILAVFVSVTVYICNAYWVSYASEQGVWAPMQCSWAGSVSQLCSALISFPIAYYTCPADVYRLLKLSTVLGFIAAPTLFFFTSLGSSMGMIFGLSLYAITNALICSSMFYFLYLQLPAKYRCRGVSTVWAMAASIGAMSLPIVEQANIHSLAWVAPVWVSFVSICTWGVLKLKFNLPLGAPVLLAERSILTL